jgi:hypothetical protein
MRQLPIIKIGRKKYYLDEKLNEMRNINNPHDSESMCDMPAKWWQELWKNGGK